MTDKLQDELNELYRQKGELSTSAEIIQGQLRNVNARIVELINAQNAPKGGKNDGKSGSGGAKTP